MERKGKKLPSDLKTGLLIDGNNLFSKYYYANKENCIRNLSRHIINLLSWSRASYAACVFDAEKCFRKEIYSEYKANRKPKPDDFNEYFSYFKSELKNIGIFQISSKTLEAEDTISLIVKKFKDIYFYVMSEDKDCLQLYQYENCCVFKKWNDPLSVPPLCEIISSDPNFISKLKLYFSLVGDSSDNIPGVPSFGPKKSNFIIEKFISYENLKKVLKLNLFELEKKDTDNFCVCQCLSKILENEKEFDLSYNLFCLFETNSDFNLDISKLNVIHR